MFHDPHLDRTTNGTGRIQTQKYHGVLDKLVTNKSPHQKVRSGVCDRLQSHELIRFLHQIPTFRETIALLMRPDNMSVFLNIDVKVDNDPERLFALMHEVVSSYPDYETVLAPRLGSSSPRLTSPRYKADHLLPTVLGLWHPKYVEPATRLIPYIRLTHIGMSPALARKYFWDACGAFSMNFSCLVGADGESFRKECKASNKDLCELSNWARLGRRVLGADLFRSADVWTVNKRAEMIEATKWGAKAILTDRTAEFLKLREQMNGERRRFALGKSRD